VVFGSPVCEFDPTGNVLRKVAAAGEEGSTGTVATRYGYVTAGSGGGSAAP
jgi:hypothetical protein